MSSIVINETLLSVTYDNDSVFPGKDYWDEIPVKVELDQSVGNVDDIKRTMVVKIGDITLLPIDIDYIKFMIDRANTIAETFK
jgi:hypothetical protein